MTLWCGIISLLNVSNIEFQKPALEIQRLKSIIQKCLKVFITIIFKNPLTNLKDVIELSLKDRDIQDQLFEDNFEEFVQKL